jgi:hypothetical protein
VFVEPDVTSVVDSEAHPGAPAEAVGSARDFLDLDHLLDPGKASKLLGDEFAFEPPLSYETDMLPVAAATAAWTCIRTGRSHAIGGGADDLARVGPEVGLRFLRDRRQNQLSREAMANEDDPAVLGSRDATATGCDRSRFQLEDRLFRHGSGANSLRFRATRIEQQADRLQVGASSPGPVYQLAHKTAVGESPTQPAVFATNASEPRQF